MSNEGHFAMGNWEDAVHKGIPNSTYKYLPISIIIVSGKMHVWGDYSNEEPFTMGDEILSINDMAVQEILEELYQFLPTDGEITAYTNRTISIGFQWYYYFFIAQSEKFKIKFKSFEEGKIKTTTVQALYKKEQIAVYSNRYSASNAEKAEESIDDFYKLTFEKNHAFLRLKSFDYRLIDRYKLKSKKLYEYLFETIRKKNVPNLIIDLRDNTGGRNEFADDMVPFILKKEAAAPFLKKTISWEGKEKTQKFPKKHKNAFEGNIYLLVNGRTYSSGATLARYLKEFGNATVIGEETGTRYDGFAAGSKQYVRLTHSDINIGIPRYHILFPPSIKQKTNNRGLIPDHEVANTLSDLKNKKDAVLEYALTLMN